MKSSWWVRFSLFLFLIIISTLMIMPTVFKFDKDSSFPIKSKINLGLDLQGGLYMVLGIDFKKVYKEEIYGYMKKLENYLKSQSLQVSMGKADDKDPMDPKHSLIVEKADQVEKVKEKIREYVQSNIRLTSENGTEIQYGIAPSLRTHTEEQALGKSIEVIRNRIDEFGVTEPEITSQGNDRIVVQLPGVKDIDRAKELIGKTAKLEFKMVNDEVTEATLLALLTKAEAQGIIYNKGDRFSVYLSKLNEFLRPDVPKGYEIAFRRPEGREARKDDGKSVDHDLKLPVLVDSIAPITGEDLEDANVQIDNQKNQPYVSMSFNTAGAKKFEDLTGNNIGKRLAVILDGNVYTAPVIQAKIGGGHAQITLGMGNFNQLIKQAKDIAIVLRAGALPVQLDFEEQRIVGPNLGTDSIKSAKFASIIGCLAVFLFVLVYYKISGVIAVFTLLVNVLLVVAALVGLEATLTLPGIAGIALTVGMAVDGNIIIYERIREEIRKGMPYFKAYEAGFEHAFWTVIDANLTTAMAGFCLLNFGTGPVRGFAVTLLIGIATTIYTAYFVSKLCFEYYMNAVSGKELSI